jgi:hypothetical protein
MLSGYSKNGRKFLRTSCNLVVDALFVSQRQHDEPVLASLHLPLWLSF